MVKIVSPTTRGACAARSSESKLHGVDAAGYGLIDSPKVQTAPGKNRQPDRSPGAEHARRGRILSAHLLAFDGQDA